jgi:hypothetical protein
VACIKERQPWEDDFEKEDFFTKKFVKKHVRVQLSNNLHTPSTDILFVATPVGMCIVDSCSDVTLARRDVLSDLYLVASPVVIAHLGGETILREARSLTLGIPVVDASPLMLHDVLAVGVRDLPHGVVALIGVADVRLLGLSLDAILDSPGCDLAAAINRRSGNFSPDQVEREVSEENAGPRWENPGRFRPPTEEEVQRHLGLRQSTLQELKLRARLEQEERTAARIGRLFLGSPPKKKSLAKQEPPPRQNRSGPGKLFGRPGRGTQKGPWA